MRPLLSALSLALAACAQTPPPQPENATPPPPAASVRTIEKARTCPGGEMTYLGFRGAGPPPIALLDEIERRLPGAAVYELGDGSLGIFIAEPHSMEVRARHEAAAAAVGWKGDVVDFASVTKTCEATFHTPVPPPLPPPATTAPLKPAAVTPPPAPANGMPEDCEDICGIGGRCALGHLAAGATCESWCNRERDIEGYACMALNASDCDAMKACWKKRPKPGKGPRRGQEGKMGKPAR